MMKMKRILVVDDVRELGYFLQAALATLDKNLDIRVMVTAEEALLEATRQPVDLLVTEVRLPGISGIDLARRIQQRFPSGKVIFISSLANKKIDQQIAALNAAAYFHKPMQIPRLLEAAASALGITPAWEREEPDQDSQERLSNRLAGLRYSLNARGIYLLDENGRVAGQTGEDAEGFLPALVEPLVGAVIANNRLAMLPGSSTGAFACTIRGKLQDMVFTPAGKYTLLLTLEPEEAGARLAMAHQQLLQAGQEIAVILTSLGAQPPAAEERPDVAAKMPEESPQEKAHAPAADEEDEFASKLMREVKKVNRQTADAFWNEQVKDGKLEPLNPDVISYEQAVKLGIAPTDEGNILPAKEE